MLDVFSFDISRLDRLLGEHGLTKTWASVLASLVRSSGDRFAYLLDEEFFVDAAALVDNPLFGLSIGEIGVLYEYCVASLDPDSRKDNGQYFTPDDVAILMVEHAKTFPEGKWLDPCSGIGNLSWHMVNAQVDKERFIIEKLVLSDRDELALDIARVLFTLSFQVGERDLYNRIIGSFVRFDFLSVADKGETTLFGNDQLKEVPIHDYVIVNPPYLALKSEDSRFETAKAKDLYAYFLENIIKTSHGFVSVTPQSFTNAQKFRSLRRLLLDEFSFLKIYTFDNIPGNIFYGVKFGSTNSNSANSIRAAITVAKKDCFDRQITSLLRWKRGERDELFRRMDKFLSHAPLSVEYFPKVSSVFIELFNLLKTRPTLKETLSTKPTSYVLYVPSAPRYFISALKKPVARASMKTLYFQSEADLNVAYLLLNSSLMYWWWRVRDGGMTLALETIHTLPMPEFAVSQYLVAELTKSEDSNKVYKMNAGKNQENVKHDLHLILKLNELVLPEYSERLHRTHDNSELVQISNLNK